LLSSCALYFYDKNHPGNPLSSITTADVFGGIILAFSAFVTSSVATIYLVLLLASSDVPVSVKAPGRVVVSVGWLVAWTARALFTRG
jgi:hypothetical protein